MADKDDKKQIENQKLQFHYLKTDNFRTCVATGFYGGITINGHVNINFYLDRTVIPKKTVIEIDKDNQGKELRDKQEALIGSVREVQSGIVMDVETAKKTIEWLQKKVDLIEENIIKKTKK